VGRRNTSGSQFFVTEIPKPHLNGGYSVFGQCDHADVVHAIARVPAEQDKPITPVTMRVRIFRQ
jgi:cyclophilin family peptidyl-prolyl cis-trans isomerase